MTILNYLFLNPVIKQALKANNKLYTQRFAQLTLRGCESSHPVYLGSVKKPKGYSADTETLCVPKVRHYVS